MNQKSNYYKYLSLFLLILSLLDGYITFKAWNKYKIDFLLGVGIFIFLILLILVGYFFNKYTKYRTISYLINSWPNSFDKRINYEQIKNLWKFKEQFKVLRNKDIFHVDNQTAEDLNIDDLFEEISTCLTSPGEQTLYHMLRSLNLNSKELNKLEKILNEINSNSSLRSELQFNFYTLGKQFKGSILDLLFSNKKPTNSKKIIINISSIVFPITFFIGLFLGSRGIALSFFSALIAMTIENSLCKDFDELGTSTSYLGYMLSTAKKLTSIDSEILSDDINDLKENLEPLNKFRKSFAIVIEAICTENPFLQFLVTLFFLRPKTGEEMLHLINDHRDNLLNIYYTIGKLDSYMSIASYRERMESYSIPKFTEKEKYINISELTHPLVDNCVTNDILIDNNGILLTGSNMSGKSTFMRTIGINILLAQSINTVPSKKYEGSFFTLFTSLSIIDDINSGDSFYLAECKSILRMLNNTNSSYSSLYMIDEIFKGTNPIERIAASTEIIKYLTKNKSVAIVATHDLVLAENCPNNYKCYYFTENVDQIHGLSFDYKLKNGICKSGNALKVLEYLSYPKEITDFAKENLNNSIN